MWTKHCQGSRCDDMGMSGTKRVPFARVWAAAVSFLFEFVGWNMENWWVFHELIGASTISTGGLDDMAQGDWNNPAKTTWKIWNDMKWHERCFPSLLKGSFMVCFTKRGHRQDGNDYDEGDLGLESLGQGGLVRHYKKPKATQGPWIFAGSAISCSFDSYVCILYVYNAYTNRYIHVKPGVIPPGQLQQRNVRSTK